MPKSERTARATSISAFCSTTAPTRPVRHGSTSACDSPRGQSAPRGDRFEDDTEAVRNLGHDKRFPSELVQRLEMLPGFRNVIVHEYVGLDMDRVVTALRDLEPVERFAEIVHQLLSKSEGDTR